MNLRTACACIVFLAVAACANHPLIDDVTHLSTYDVMHKVRCEAAGAIQTHYQRKLAAQIAGRERDKKSIAELDKRYKAKDADYKRDLAQYTVRKKELDGLILKKAEISSLIAALEQVVKDLETKLNDPSTDPQQIKLLETLIQNTAKRVEKVTEDAYLTAKLSAQVAAELSSEEPRLRAKQSEQNKLLIDITRRQKDFDREYASLNRFDQVNVAMIFAFEITENNNATVAGSVTWPVNLGTLTLGLDATNDRKRESDRKVSTVTTFNKLNKLNCGDAPAGDGSGRARDYPITGNIGIAELVEQYFKVSDSIGLKTDAESFRDKLTFTTSITGGLKPSIELAPVSPSRVTASVDLSADRKDVHEVTVALYPVASTAESARPEAVEIVSGPEAGRRATRSVLDRYLNLNEERHE